MIKKILVPTDGSDHAKKAIEIASDLALKYGATICLLHVVSLPVIFHEGIFPAMEGMLKLLEEAWKRTVRRSSRKPKGKPRSAA
jgi:nucleotide-binding universal stress UspA family protein